MPYVEGETLRGKIEREKQLSVKDALDIAKKVAGALDYADGRGVVHPDDGEERGLGGPARVVDRPA